MLKADVAAAATTFAGASKNVAPTGAQPAADVAAGAATIAGTPKPALTEQAKAPKDNAETQKRTCGALRFQWKRVAVTRNAAAARREQRMKCSSNSPSLKYLMVALLSTL